MSPTSFPFLKKIYLEKKWPLFNILLNMWPVSKDVKSGQMESYFTNMDLPEIRGRFPETSAFGGNRLFFFGRELLWPETSLSPESEFARPVFVVHVWLHPGAADRWKFIPKDSPRFRQNKKGSKIQSFGTKLNACVPWLGSISYKNCINYIIQFQCANTSLEDRSLCSKSGDRGNVLVGTLLTSTCRPSLFLWTWTITS